MEHKPFTKEQKSLIDTCSRIIASWNHTNDKDSPTHMLYMESELRLFELSNHDGADLRFSLEVIFNVIKKYESDKI